MLDDNGEDGNEDQGGNEIEQTSSILLEDMRPAS